MKHLLEIMFVLLLLATNTACAAVSVPLPVDEIDALAPGSTLWGINQALKGVIGTTRLMSPSGQFFLAWPGCPGSGTYCFVLIDPKTFNPLRWKDIGGNVTTPAHVRELVDYALLYKWRAVSVGDAALVPLENGIAAAISERTLLNLWSSPLIVFSLMPSEMFDFSLIPESELQ